LAPNETETEHCLTSSIYGSLRKNWKVTVLEDLKKLILDWDAAENMAKDRGAWHSCVAHVLQARGRTEV